MIADPEGPSFITRTVGRRRDPDDAFVSHDPELTSGRVVQWRRFSERAVRPHPGAPHFLTIDRYMRPAW
jgi:hypothetical protein